MKITDVVKIINKMGLSWFAFRISYELKRKTGILKKKFPINNFSDKDFIDKIVDYRVKSKKGLSKFVKQNRNKFLFNAKDLDLF